MTKSVINIVVTGANGQVGRELQRVRWPADFAVTALSSADLDITDSEQVRSTMGRLHPTVIINAAAYTAVDKAETDEDRATQVNAAGVANLASAANHADALLIHISTDYVFDGSKDEPYVESDPLAPVGAYGRSKAAGEHAAATATRHIILRTAWVYGALGANFVTTMLRLAGERDKIGVVDDQIGCPTAAGDIASAIFNLTVADQTSNAIESGLYHLASPDSASWFDVAAAIFELSKNGFGGELSALTTEQYPTPARRPANSRLNTDKIANELGIRLPSWRNSLAAVVQELEANS